MCAKLKGKVLKKSFPLFKVGKFCPHAFLACTSSHVPLLLAMHKITFFLFLFTIHLTSWANEIYTQPVADRLVASEQYCASVSSGPRKCIKIVSDLRQNELF